MKVQSNLFIIVQQTRINCLCALFRYCIICLCFRGVFCLCYVTTLVWSCTRESCTVNPSSGLRRAMHWERAHKQQDHKIRFCFVHRFYVFILRLCVSGPFNRISISNTLLTYNIQNCVCVHVYPKKYVLILFVQFSLYDENIDILYIPTY